MDFLVLTHKDRLAIIIISLSSNRNSSISLEEEKESFDLAYYTKQKSEPRENGFQIATSEYIFPSIMSFIYLLKNKIEDNTVVTNTIFRI